MLVNGEIISNFRKKGERFSKVFASKGMPFLNRSILPPLTIRADKRLSSLKINEGDILPIIKSLDSNKSHDWESLPIKMTKM